jgi:hypothetical protein
MTRPMRNLTPRELAEATGDYDAIHGPARHLDAKDMVDGPRWVTPACMAACLMIWAATFHAIGVF